MKLHQSSNLAALVVGVCCILPMGSAFAADTAAPAKKPAMSPEIKLVDDYNTWFLGGAYAGDPEKLKAGLPKYITNETALHEAASLPWGGTLVGYQGWVELKQKSSPVFAKISPLMEASAPKYYQRGNVVLHEITLTIKGSPAAPQPFSMGLMEKYTIENGRIKQIDEFYADTASFLDRLAALGAIPAVKK